MPGRESTIPGSADHAIAALRKRSGNGVLALLMLLAACQSTGVASVVPTDPVDAVDRRIWFAAAEDGDAGLLRALIDDGIDPLIERDGLTALHIAARDGHLEAARVLIDAGVDIDPGPDGREAVLADAAGHGSAEMLELVVGADLGPDAVAALANLRTPLNLAVQNGRLDMVGFLIGAGADVDAHGEWYSPLHSAVLVGDPDIVSMLLENGASPRTRVRIQDRSRFSGFRYVDPVELAALISRDDLVDLLTRHGGRD